MYFSEIKDSKMRWWSHDLFSNLFPKKETFPEFSGKIRKNPEIWDVITCNYIRLHKLGDKITSTRTTGRALKLFLVISLINPPIYVITYSKKVLMWKNPGFLWSFKTSLSRVLSNLINSYRKFFWEKTDWTCGLF